MNLDKLSPLLGLLALMLLSQLTLAVSLQEQTVAMDDGHRLMLYSKSAPQPWGSILLVHGRTWSALPDFDLVTEAEDLSMMNALAAKGLAVYAIDLRGYGKSERDSSGWNTPTRAAKDLATTLDFIHNKHPDLGATTLFGWSNGSLVAMLTAQLYPNKVERLVLYGFPLDTIAAGKTPTQPPRLATTAAAAAEDFILPGTISKSAVEAYVKAALMADPIRTDWRALEQWNQLDATKLTRPTLLLQAESDPYMNLNADAELFKKIAAKDKQWLILGNADHAALLETSRFKLYHAVVSFMQYRDN
ncbi:alpha/beta fold hydrolase [Simiduia curdlanivorans]|uniref:Alpha/beta hydrolase n=1 Tax=Simiduia curdlanivorans TaxID=1492769 RepID=A0ABV8UYE9_9GAMM|nr:alpha/beta fold hydrolase [Simiduia curdlanivorans]MDN3640342.1 alpha/beta fold hydrolase [Simiduia curdlanivorans]